MLFLKLFVFTVQIVAHVSFAGRLPCKSRKVNRNDELHVPVAHEPERRSKPQNRVIGLTDEDFRRAANTEIKDTETDGTDDEDSEETIQPRIDNTKPNPKGRSDVKLWPNARIYYQIAKPADKNLQFNVEQTTKIATGICLIELRSCVRIIFSDKERDYISVEKSVAGGCSSHVGKSSGKQILKLTPLVKGTGCFDVPGTVAHEFMHAAGFWHEHQRTDRNKHIEVHFENIPAKKQSNFNYRYPPSGTYAGNVVYDLKSIMQYSGGAFANPGTNSITPVDKKISKVVRQRKDLSDSDIKRLNAFYKCKDQGNGNWLVDGKTVEPTKCKKLRGM